MYSRSLLFTAVAVTLSGCSGSIFDPAPYQPERDRTVLESKSPSYDSVTLLQFTDLSDAAYKLRALASGYADARDTIMRQQLLVDIPAIGLGVATVANGVFRGAKDATIALGLGSATVGGTRLYFGPQVKVTAYNNAASALMCASSVATQMLAESQLDGAAANALSDQLSQDISLATTMITGGALSKQDSVALLSSRDAAQKALSDLNGALSTLSTAHAQLQGFAITVLRGATTKVVTGTQNIDAVLSLIKSSLGSSSSSSGGGGKPVTPAGVGPRRGVPAPSPSELAARLQSLATQATPVAKRIADVWTLLSNCSNTS